MEDIINQIKEWLIEVKDDENDCNEGSLTMHYDKIMFSLDYMLDLWNQYKDIYNIKVNKKD